MASAAMSKNKKIAMSATVSLIATKFGKLTQFYPLDGR